MNGDVVGAEFSSCKKYRYVLWRIWDKSLPPVMFICLNPSRANERNDDPTIRRVKSFAQKWGYGGVYMTNLFSIVTPYPVELLSCADPVNGNDEWLMKVAAICKDVIFAWGNNRMAQERALIISGLFPEAKVLRLNKNGSPMHPLYVPGDAVPVLYRKVE